jgi:hypothetical protein
MGGLSSQHHAAIVSGDHERGRDRRLDQQRLFLADTLAAHRRSRFRTSPKSPMCAVFFWDAISVESSGGLNPLRVFGVPKPDDCSSNMCARLNEVAPAPPLQPQR